jgi:hypothetical protein
MEKKCSKCGEIKLASEFYSKHYYCKKCFKTYTTYEKSLKYLKVEPEHRKQYQKAYHKNYINDYYKRRKEDPIFKLKCNIRSRISTSLLQKNKHTEQILGCSFEDFRVHLESQFESWMSWDNYGGQNIDAPNIRWDIDHINPLHSAQSVEDVLRLNHYTNLRPLCSYDNRYVKRKNLPE